jgi:hypothetical protein
LVLFFKKEPFLLRLSKGSPMIRIAAILAIAACAPALAQTTAIPIELPTVTPAPGNPATLSAPSLDQLVAPVALYPDMQLTDILAASTYPAQIVEAWRFASDPANQGLQADALAQEAAAHGWDQSVQALLPFPQILQHLDTDLEWTDRLGQAFLAQPADVLDAVQRLRARAMAAGTLYRGPQDDVQNDGGAIAINPPSPQEIFVPSYDAACVYGADAGCGGDDFIAWGAAVFLPYGAQRWGSLDWHRHHIRLGGGHVEAGPGTAPADVVWHHVGRENAPISAGPPASFQYAPPPGLRFSAGGARLRGIAPASFAARGQGARLSAPPRSAPVARVAPAAHSAGMAVGRR